MHHTFRHLLQAATVVAAVCAGPGTPLALAATEATVQAHVDTATKAAGSDLGAFLRLCQPAPAQRPTPTDESLAKLIATPGPQAQAAFDNLFYLGSGWVSAWALKTSDGIVLIDALNTAEEVDRLVVGGMRQLGLDPAQIRTVLVTHGHGDHYGGAQRLKELAGATPPRLVMSALDWQMTATQLEFASPLWPTPPRFDAQRDMAARDGEVLRQGDAQITMPLTPGHTLGTISPVIDVQSGNRSWRAVIWGGTGFNFGRDLARMDAYIASTDRMRELVRAQGIEVLLSNHPSYDGTDAKLAQLRTARAADAPHPFVVGTDAVLRALTVAGECARANKARFEMQR